MKKIEIKMAKRVIDPDIRDFLHFIDMATILYEVCFTDSSLRSFHHSGLMHPPHIF